MLAPCGAEPVRDLPDRRVGTHRLDQGRHQVLVAPGALSDPPERGLPGDRVPFRADASQALHLAPFAIWVDALNMNDPATVAEALRRAGFDAQALVAIASEQATKDALKATTQSAVERGVFGAPTFFVGDQMFWGQDRLDFVAEALAG